MSGISAVRDKIVSLKGAEFTTHDLPKYPAVHSALGKMVKASEIRFVRLDHSDGGRPLKVYVEVKVKEERKNASKKLKRKETPMPNWCKVWPEFFTAPAFVISKITNIDRWSECHE